MGEIIKTSTLSKINCLAEAALTTSLIASEDFSQTYGELTTLINYLTDFKKNVDTEIKKVVKENYFRTGDNSVTSEGFKYTYVPETTRESFNTVAFKKDDPETYKRYVRVSAVSDSLRTTRIVPSEEKITVIND